MEQLSLLDEARRRQPVRSDFEHVEGIAANVIAELDLAPPIDLRIVASYRNIVSIQVADLPVAGMLTPTKGRLTMTIRASDGSRRQRFTGFHEVGHTFLPGYWDSPSFRCSPAEQSARTGSRDFTEVLSDAAAAGLILPRVHLEPDLLEGTFSMGTFFDLADRYEASREATLYRISSMWPEDCMMVILEPGLRKSERLDPQAVKRLRVVTASPRGAAWPFIPRNKSAQDDSPLLEALGGAPVESWGEHGDFGLSSQGRLHLTARKVDYTVAGSRRTRVFALYRRLERSK